MNRDNITPFYLDKYGSFSASLTDIIAVKYGLKPLARLSCDFLDKFYRVKNIFDDDGLFSSHSRHKILSGKNKYLTLNNPLNGLVDADNPADGTIYIYLSKSKSLVTEFAVEDPELSLSKPKHKDVERFAQSLGYPQCCIDSYLGKNSREIFKNLPEQEETSFYLNNLLHSVSNYYFSFHLPCNYRCSKSIAYNKDIFYAIKEEIPLFAKKLITVLKLPLLVFFLSHSFDDRIVIFFEGNLINKNNITYGKSYILKTHYFKDNSWIDNMGLGNFRYGDEIKIDKTGINIIYKNKPIFLIPRKSHIFNFCLFNFY